MKKLAVLGLASCIALGSNGDEYFINTKKRIEILLSNIGVNRLVLANDRILKIVGSEDEYIIEADQTRGHAFVASKLGSGEKSFATIISEKGLVQDVMFKIDGDSPPVTVVLKRPGLIQNRVSKRSSIEASHTSKIQDIFTDQTRGFRQRSLSVGHFKDLPFKVNQAVEYLSLKHNYIWLDVAPGVTDGIVDIDFLKRLPGILAIAKQNNNLILVRKSWKNS